MEDSYQIKGGDATAKISTLGGTAAVFIVGNTDFFYPQHMIGDKARGGCPLCAPWFGSSKRGAKKHGFLRDTRASGAFFGKNAACLEFHDQGRSDYPWPLGYETRSSIKEDGTLKMILRIRREKDGIAEDAPINAGFHPYFACMDSNKVEVIVGNKTFKGFAEESRMIPLESEEVVIYIPQERIIRMRLSGDFFRLGKPQLVLWTDAPGKYACVEPIFQPYDWFDTPRGFFLEEDRGMKFIATFEIM